MINDDIEMIVQHDEEDHTMIDDIDDEIMYNVENEKETKRK